MAEDIQHHYTVSERQIELYQKLDIKVRAARFVFDGLYNLPILSPSSDEVVEEKHLDTLFQNTLAFFPEYTRQQYARFVLLRDGSKEIKERADDWQQLSDNEDVQFLQNCEFAIRGTKVKRGFSRTVLGMIYRKEHSVEELLVKLHDIHLIKNPMHIIPDRFSIHVVLDHETYTAYRQGSVGMHHAGLFWNFIDDESEIYTNMARRLHMTPYAVRQEVLAHEDAHSLLESFLHDGQHTDLLNARIGATYRSIDNWEKELMEAHEANRSIKIRAITQELRKRRRELLGYLRQVEDSNREEMLAEWISAPTRRSPQLTYANRLTGIIEGLTPYTSLPITSLTRRLQAFDGRIRLFHTLTENRAPQHIRDLQFALAIIPPSEWRHIPGLINYWASERRTVATSMAL